MRRSVIGPVTVRRGTLDPVVEAPLELSLFGTLAARRGGDAIALRLPQQAIRLLAYLLLHRDRSQTREHVAFTLWPDDDEADARANLRRKLHLLQRALPVVRAPWIITTPTSVGWNNAAPYKLDIADFEALCAAPESAAQADALYTSDLLVDLYDDWIERERDRLRTLAMENLLTLVAAHQKRRDYAAAIRFAQRLRAIDPWREDAVRALITLRYESGDRAGALTEFERFRASLAAEMSVEPMPETVVAYERALAYADTGTPVDAVAAAEPERPARGLPFVSREGELRRLLGAWSQATRGAGSAVLVVGEAGIGKSRLIDEFATVAAANGARVLRGGTTPFEIAPYQPFSEALRGALPILRETAVDPLWLAVLATIVPQLHVAFPEIRRLGALDAEPERARLFDAVQNAIKTLSAARPMVLIIEDLHWAGAATTALFEHLARHAAQQHVLILASYREEDVPRTHPLRALRRRLERERLLHPLALGPLDRTAVESIVGEFVDDDPADRGAIARYLHQSSDGNPFFLGEIVANDRESGFLDEIARRWRRRDSTAAANVSLGSTIGARLERLSLRARSVAEVGAVIGRSFSAELVRDVTGLDERSTLDSLGELIDRRIVREVETAGASYAFAHELIQQAVYAGLSPEARMRRHRRVGNVIEELYGDALDQYAGELASHFDRGSEPERAADYYCRAGRHVLALYGNEEARTLASRAREITHDARTRFAAIEIFEEASRRLADRPAQRDSVAQLLAIARELNDPGLLREALRRQIVLAHDCAERDQERDAIAALKSATAGAEAPWASILAQLTGSYLTAIGSYREARSVMADALGEISPDKYPRIYVECRCALVELAAYEGRSDDIRSFLDDVPTFESRYDLSLAVTLMETACSAASKIQDYAALGLCAERLLEYSRTIGYREGEATGYLLSGRAALRLFHIDEAYAALKSAIQMFDSMGQRLKQLSAMIEIGNLQARVGRFTEALGEFEAARVIGSSINSGFGEMACLNNMSFVACLNGEYERAREAARQALSVADAIESRSGRAHTLVNMGVAERELGELSTAIGHLEQGTALHRELNELVALGEDMCELITALVRAGERDRASSLADEVIALATDSKLQFSHPQQLFWTVAAVRYANGDRARARALLVQARQILDSLESAIPDVSSRATFRGLRYNRSIDDAFDRNAWKL